MDILRTQFVQRCPKKLIEQSHRQIGLAIDGFSDIPEELTSCDPNCSGPLELDTSSVMRRIGHSLLPGLVDETVPKSVCRQDVPQTPNDGV